MLRNRLIPTVVIKSGLVVQSFNFKNFLPIGKVDAVIEFLINWDVDEIIVLDIDATKEKRLPDFKIIERIARKCFVPLTVGGGVHSMDTIAQLLLVGADKIVINSAIVENPTFISEIAEKYGSQFVVASIDAKSKDDGTYEAYCFNGTRPTGIDPVNLAIKCEKLGAGEIFINSIDRDGSRRGYDLNLLKSITSSVKIPVIACGGVGKISDLEKGINEGKCQAVSAANIFYHFELSTIAGKAHMRNKGIPIRINSKVKYEGFNFDFLGRPI